MRLLVGRWPGPGDSRPDFTCRPPTVTRTAFNTTYEPREMFGCSYAAACSRFVTNQTWSQTPRRCSHTGVRYRPEDECGELFGKIARPVQPFITTRHIAIRHVAATPAAADHEKSQQDCRGADDATPDSSNSVISRHTSSGCLDARGLFRKSFIATMNPGMVTPDDEHETVTHR